MPNYMFFCVVRSLRNTSACSPEKKGGEKKEGVFAAWLLSPGAELCPSPGVAAIPTFSCTRAKYSRKKGQIQILCLFKVTCLKSIWRLTSPTATARSSGAGQRWQGAGE